MGNRKQVTGSGREEESGGEAIKSSLRFGQIAKAIGIDKEVADRTFPGKQVGKPSEFLFSKAFIGILSRSWFIPEEKVRSSSHFPRRRERKSGDGEVASRFLGFFSSSYTTSQKMVGKSPQRIGFSGPHSRFRRLSLFLP